MKPTITQTTNGYCFDFLDAKIKLLVSRVHVHTDGRVTGELEIKYLDGEKANTINPASTFNFSSDTTRSRLVKSMQIKRNNTDWATIIDYLCKNVLELSRCGEPVIDVYAGDETAIPPRYLLDPFIIENYPNVIFGDPGTLKSTLALLLSQLMMLPCPDNVLGLTVSSESMRVLYCDWETDEATIKWQLTLLQNGLGISPLFVHYRRCSLPLAQELEGMRAAIADKNIKVLVIDSLGLACGGELKEAQPALEFFKALRTLNITTLILAHCPKPQEGVKTKSIYGSMYFRALARNVWEIQKSQEQGSDTANISLYHDKPAPFQNIHKPLGYKFIYDNKSVIVECEDPKTIEEFLQRMCTSERILKLLETRAMTQKEMKEELGLSYAALSMAMKRLLNKKRVVKLADEKWGLIAQGELS